MAGGVRVFAVTVQERKDRVHFRLLKDKGEVPVEVLLVYFCVWELDQVLDVDFSGFCEFQLVASFELTDEVEVVGEELSHLLGVLFDKRVK